MTTFKWICLGIITMMLLSACGGNTTPTAKLTLTANLTEVPSGGKVVLTVTQENVPGIVAVEFSVVGQNSFFTDNTPGDGFKADSPQITTDTRFTAFAKDSANNALPMNEVLVKVMAGSAQPKAGNKDVTTLAGVPVVGGTATGLAVLTDKLVVENGTPEKVSEDGGVVTIETDGSFTFAPNIAEGPASFKYKVVNGANSAEGTVTVTVKALPADTQIVKDAAELTTATATGSTVKTILISGTIVCSADPCAGLEAGQKLIGAGVIDGVTLGGAAKLDMTRAGDETTPPENNNSIGVVLASDTTVEGIEISGRDIYTAINGVAINLRQPGSPADNPTASTITIKNVKITGPTSDSPFKIEFTGPPAEDFEAYYDLNIDGLMFTGVAGKPIGFSAFEDLELKNSNIEISADAPGVTGISVRAYSGPTTALIENVVITSAKGGAGFSPLEIGQSSAGGVLTATVKNTTVTFADDIDKENAAFPFYFNFGNSSPGAGKIVIEGSTGNTSNTASNDPIRLTGGAAKIDGEIELNGATISIP